MAYSIGRHRGWLQVLWLERDCAALAGGQSYKMDWTVGGKSPVTEEAQGIT